MLMQEVWRCGLDWNDTLPEELSVKMKLFLLSYKYYQRIEFLEVFS